MKSAELGLRKKVNRKLQTHDELSIFITLNDKKINVMEENMFFQFRHSEYSLEG